MVWVGIVPLLAVAMDAVAAACMVSSEDSAPSSSAAGAPIANVFASAATTDTGLGRLNGSVGLPGSK
ncbi:hypothetical protein D3C71_1807540 [compost metagenome]